MDSVPTSGVVQATCVQKKKRVRHCGSLVQKKKPDIVRLIANGSPSFTKNIRPNNILLSVKFASKSGISNNNEGSFVRGSCSQCARHASPRRAFCGTYVFRMWRATPPCEMQAIRPCTSACLAVGDNAKHNKAEPPAYSGWSAGTVVTVKKL